MRSGSRLSFPFVTSMTTAASTLYAFCAVKHESSDSTVAKHKLLDKSAHRDSKSVRRESGNGFNSNKIRAVYFFYRFSTGCLVGSHLIFFPVIHTAPLKITSYINFSADPLHDALYGTSIFFVLLISLMFRSSSECKLFCHNLLVVISNSNTRD